MGFKQAVEWLAHSQQTSIIYIIYIKIKKTNFMCLMFIVGLYFVLESSMNFLSANKMQVFYFPQ